MYKHRANLKKKEASFEMGDMVLAHPRKERFPKKEYNTLKFKKIGPCIIVKKF